MLLFNGRVWTDDGGLGMLTIQFNEDVGNETMADIIWGAMINEGDDFDDNRLWEERVQVYIYRDGELSAGGRQESNAISCVHFEM